MEEMTMETPAAARKRIDLILDAGSFMELGGHVVARNTDFTMGEGKSPSDGVVSGYGTVEGRPVYIYSQEPKSLGGSLAEMHAAKILRVYEMAQKSGTPVIGLIDCSGLRIQEGADALDAFGKIYKVQTQVKGMIPQIAGIFGTCGGGMALVPALCDFTFVQDQASVFINPAATRPIEGERVDILSALNNNPAGESLADGRGTEGEICESIKNLLSYLPLSFEDNIPVVDCMDDLNRAGYDLDSAATTPDEMIEQIADAGSVFMLGENKEKDAITCFVRLNGRTVGVMANRGDGYITAAACEKIAKFADFCDAFGIAILTLTDAKGFAFSNEQESLLPAAAAYLVSVFSSACVPKVNVIVRNAFGSAYTVMNSKGLGADFVFAWENAKAQVMPEAEASQILYSREMEAVQDKKAFLAQKAQEYVQQAGTASFVSRGYIEKIIKPEDTRKYVIGAFEMLSATAQCR
jgi:methylmalonyl-CoA decarboxylase subunit alpha